MLSSETSVSAPASPLIVPPCPGVILVTLSLPSPSEKLTVPLISQRTCAFAVSCVQNEPAITGAATALSRVTRQSPLASSRITWLASPASGATASVVPGTE